MMRILLALLLVAGLSTSAILESKESPNSGWDDDDDAVLSLPKAFSSTRSPSDDKPHFIPLTSSSADSDDKDASQYEYSTESRQAEESRTSEDSISSSTEATSTSSSGSSDSSAPEAVQEEDKKDLPQTHLMQLGKIPLKLRVIPLIPTTDETESEVGEGKVPEERRHLLGRKDERPVDLDDDLEDGQKDAKKMPSEDDSAQAQSPTEPETSGEDQFSHDLVRVRTPSTSTSNSDSAPPALMPEPLTYMIPPRPDTPDLWRTYPETPEELQPSPTQTTPDPTLNPFLERLRDFLQKAKRHSLEQQEGDGEVSDPSETSNEEVNDNNNKSVENTENEENEELLTPPEAVHSTVPPAPGPLDFTPSPRAPDYSNEQMNHHFVNYPRPGVPEVVDYQPAQSQPTLPPYQHQIPTFDQLRYTQNQNSIGYLNSAPDQNIGYLNWNPELSANNLDYLSLNSTPRQNQNIGYLSLNSAPRQSQDFDYFSLNSAPRQSQDFDYFSLNSAPRPPVYIPNDEYWPRRFFYGNLNNELSLSRQLQSLTPAPASAYQSSNYYNDYFNLRPQRSYIPNPSFAPSALNSLNLNSNYQPGAYDGDFGQALLNNRRGYSNLNFGAYYEPSYRSMEQQQFVPYASSRNGYYSNPLVSQLMYAPMYPYQRRSRSFGMTPSARQQLADFF